MESIDNAARIKYLFDGKGSEPMSDFIVNKGAGTLVWLGGLGVNFKLDGDDTKGAFSIVEHPIEPGTLVPPHMHTHEDEFSYVLECWNEACKAA